LAAAACGSDDKATPTRTVSDNPTPIQGVATAAAFPVTVKRSDGKELKVDKPVTKIVSLSPGATEILYALGAEKTLAAVDKNADYPAAAQSFEPKVDAYEPNVEAIAGLSPDLVIVASDTNGIVAALDRLNVPVLYIDLDKDVKTVDDVYGQIGLIGRLTGTEDKAIQIITDLTARQKAVEEKLVGLPNTSGPTVYHELDSTFYSISDNTFIGSLYRTLKARNIAKDGGGIAYPQLTQESIISADPEIIVLADEEFGVSIASVRSRPGWAAMKAVQENRIYAIDPDIISRPGPRIIDALEALARNFYPQAFGPSPTQPAGSTH
ncbi:MAG TPA: ABC transporter substrate-binding protein, partial [Dehalococcoidia bacterium]